MARGLLYFLRGLGLLILRAFRLLAVPVLSRTKESAWLRSLWDPVTRRIAAYFALVAKRMPGSSSVGVFNASRNRYSRKRNSQPSTQASLSVSHSGTDVSQTNEVTETSFPGGGLAKRPPASRGPAEVPDTETAGKAIFRNPSRANRMRWSGAYTLGLSILALSVLLAWSLNDAGLPIGSGSLSEQAEEEMERRRELLRRLNQQQDELHTLLQARPSRGLLESIIRPATQSEPVSYEQPVRDQGFSNDNGQIDSGEAARQPYPSLDTVYALEMHLSANQRYLSEGLGVLQAIPHRWPVQGRVRLINSHYGNRKSPFSRKTQYHGGLDLKARSGDAVVSSAEGYVYRVGVHGGFGKMVHIIHPSGYETIYAHLSKINVKKGQTVRAGHELGQAGDSGITTGPHLHYEVRLDGKRLDPIRYLIP